MNITTWQNKRIAELEKENNELYAYIFDLSDESFIWNNLEKYAEYAISTARMLGEFEFEQVIIRFEPDINIYIIYKNGESQETASAEEAAKIFRVSVEGNY